MVDEPTIEDLAAEARQCEMRGDFAEALDYYEEIDRRGEARVEHLAGMGNCFLQTRQRQDARRVWVRAFEMNPDNQQIIDLLDKNFKGWEKSIGAHKAGAHGTTTPPPPPPAPDTTKISLSFEKTNPPERPEPPVRPQPPPQPQRRPAPEDTNEFEHTGSLRPSSRPTSQNAGGAARPVPSSASKVPAGNQLPPINWDYVMADAMAESGKSH